MKVSYEAYMGRIEPSEAFRAVLEARMKRAFHAPKRRRDPRYVAVATVVVVALLLAVLLNRPDTEDDVVHTAPVAAEGDAVEAPNNTAAPLNDGDLPAPAMTLEEAKDAVLRNDPLVAGAQAFWMYRSSETNGMWVVYANDQSKFPMEGGAWFVTPDQAVPLGHTQALSDWDFFSCAPQPPAPDGSDRSGASIWPATQIARGPELMDSTTDRLNAWTLGADHLPQKVDTGKLIGIEAECGQLVGIVGSNDCDYAFLAMDDGALVQIAATPIGEAVVRGFPDGSRLLDQLIAQGYALTGFLYRAAVPGSAANLEDLPNTAGSIAVNLEKDGRPWHTYFYYCDPGNALDCIDGADWGSTGDEFWIATFEGAASERLDAGLETVETLLID